MKTSSTLGLGLLLAAGIGTSVVSAGCNDTVATGGAGGAGSSTTTTGTKMATSTTGSMTTSSATTTTSTGAMGSGSSSSSTGGGFIVCDAATVFKNMPQTDCDMLQQDCDGNMTCTATGTAQTVTGTACNVNAGLKALGESCTQDTECEKGSICLGYNPMTGELGYCTRVCCPATHEPCGFGKCNVSVKFDDAGMQTAQMCSFAPSCELFTANACAGSADCHPEEDGLSTCSNPSPNPAPLHGACMYKNDCGDMQACIPIGADPNAATCEYVCKLGNTTSAPGMGGCPAGQACDVGLEGFEGLMVGVCN